MPQTLKDAERMVTREYTPPTALTVKARPNRYLLSVMSETKPTPILLDAERIQAMIARERRAPAEPSKAVVEKFNRLKAQWIREQATSSRMRDIVLSVPYQNIIGMGRDALPLLLREIKTSPYYWFWALERITEANPAENSTTHEEMVSAWLEWARTNA